MHISIVTGTRAEWSLLSPIAKALRDSGKAKVSIIATNMHLDETYGMTVNEIIGDGFTVDYRVPMKAASDTSGDTARAAAQCMSGMVDAFERLKPDLLIILGDRYEMLAVATAATIMRIPIVHISGGEITEGAIDDSIRHALTKLSALHLPTTAQNARRIVAMGEDEKRVVNTGSIAVYNMLNVKPMPRALLEGSIGMTLDRDTMLVTYHPATNDDAPVAERFGQLLAALDRFPKSKILFTYPNNDPKGRVIISMIADYVAANPSRCIAVPSLGRDRYISALHYVGVVVGNSSSGIVEVPSMQIPTVDVGIRQRGRTASESVIHTADNADAIAEGIARAFSSDFRKRVKELSNPYYQPDTLNRIVETILSADPQQLKSKHFIDNNI